MRYSSTRGESPAVTFDRAVIEGQAPDGGLYIPISIPDKPILGLRDASSPAELARRFFPDWIGKKVDAALADEAFAIEIPVVDLGATSSEYDGIHVVELFHGPTGSFKDFGARFLARWLSSEIPSPRRTRIVLVATSGDTGSAVADGFAGQPDTCVVVLYPFEGVSAYQRAQLTKPRQGVFSFAVRGSFDDCQLAVKEAFRDPALSELQLTSANSINIGRLVPQMLFYLWAALRVDCKDPVFVVPSGNLGNLCAGLLAGRSSMPTARYIAATNRNRYLIDYLNDEEAEVCPVQRTLSNAMDVAVPSNLERMTHLFSRRELLSLVSGRSVSDDETRDTMRRVWSETGYVADPHTSVGLAAALGSNRDRPALVMGTANPDKYGELVDEVTGRAVRPLTSWDGELDENVIDAGLPPLRRVILDIVEGKSK